MFHLPLRPLTSDESLTIKSTEATRKLDDAAHELTGSLPGGRYIHAIGKIILDSLEGEDRGSFCFSAEARRFQFRADDGERLLMDIGLTADDLLAVLRKSLPGITDRPYFAHLWAQMKQDIEAYMEATEQICNLLTDAKQNGVMQVYEGLMPITFHDESRGTDHTFQTIDELHAAGYSFGVFHGVICISDKEYLDQMRKQYHQAKMKEMMEGEGDDGPGLEELLKQMAGIGRN